MTSLGLNEQELSFISHILAGPHADLFGSGHQPQVHQVCVVIAYDLLCAETNPEI